MEQDCRIKVADVMREVRKAAGVPDILRRIQYWFQLLECLYGGDILEEDMWQDSCDTVSRLLNRRVSIYVVSRMFREFGLDIMLDQPQGLSLDNIEGVLNDDGADYDEIMEEVYWDVGEPSLFGLVGSVLYWTDFPELDEEDRSFITPEMSERLGAGVKTRLKELVLPVLGKDAGFNGEKLEKLAMSLVDEMGFALIIEQRPVYRELEKAVVPAEEEALKSGLLKRQYSIILEPVYYERAEGELPVSLTTLNGTDPETGNYIGSYPERIDVVELGFRFIALLYVEYVKRRKYCDDEV